MLNVFRGARGALGVAALALGGSVSLSGSASAAGPTAAVRLFESHAWLGVAMDKAAEAADGVRVRHVVRGSPADKAGVKEGDAIRAIDGAKVGAPDEVTRAVGDRDPGDTIVATVTRGGGEMTIRIALASRPTVDEMVRMDHVGAAAPSWIGVRGVGDAPTSLSALRGKVVVLDFWATWCGPCRAVGPKLSAMQARYGAQGLRVVGMTTEDGEDAALFAQRYGVRYPQASDPTAETTKAYGVSALPTLFVIDKRGVVRDVSIGYSPDHDERIEAVVKQLLAEPAPAG